MVVSMDITSQCHTREHKDLDIVLCCSSSRVCFVIVGPIENLNTTFSWNMFNSIYSRMVKFNTMRAGICQVNEDNAQIIVIAIESVIPMPIHNENDNQD